MGTAARELTGTVSAKARYIRMSASKVREVAALIKGKQIDEARRILAFTPKAAAREISKVLESAVANAEHNFHLRQEELIVKVASADEGLTMKRLRPRARGRANRIRKRMCAINIVLERSEELAALAQVPAPRRRARAGAAATGSEGAKEAAPRRRRKAAGEAPAEKAVSAKSTQDEKAAVEEAADSGPVAGTEVEAEAGSPATEAAATQVEAESASVEDTAEPSSSEEPTPAETSQSEEEEGKS